MLAKLTAALQKADGQTTLHCPQGTVRGGSRAGWAAPSRVRPPSWSRRLAGAAPAGGAMRCRWQRLRARAASAATRSSHPLAKRRRLCRRTAQRLQPRRLLRARAIPGRGAGEAEVTEAKPSLQRRRLRHRRPPETAGCSSEDVRAAQTWPSRLTTATSQLTWTETRLPWREPAAATRHSPCQCPARPAEAAPV